VDERQRHRHAGDDLAGVIDGDDIHAGAGDVSQRGPAQMMSHGAG
jgi:hypothetical protein